jgi:hypothetical protein
MIAAYPIVPLAAGLVLASTLARRNFPTRDMAALLYRAASNWLRYAALLTLVHVALEPVVRARRPHSLLTRNGAFGYPYILANALRLGRFGYSIICGLRALLRNVLLTCLVASVLFTSLVAYSIVFVRLGFGLLPLMPVIFFVKRMRLDLDVAEGG